MRLGLLLLWFGKCLCLGTIPNMFEKMGKTNIKTSVVYDRLSVYKPQGRTTWAYPERTSR